METNYQDQVKVLKAFCDENRLKVLQMLRDGEKCACKLLENLDCGQSGLSYHMKILVESGVVVSRQAGKWTYYRISPEGGAYALDLLMQSVTITHISMAQDCCQN